MLLLILVLLHLQLVKPCQHESIIELKMEDLNSKITLTEVRKGLSLQQIKYGQLHFGADEALSNCDILNIDSAFKIHKLSYEDFTQFLGIEQSLNNALRSKIYRLKQSKKALRGQKLHKFLEKVFYFPDHQFKTDPVLEDKTERLQSVILKQTLQVKRLQAEKRGLKRKTSQLIRSRETKKVKIQNEQEKNKKALNDLKFAEKEKKNVVESMRKATVHKVKAQTMELKSKLVDLQHQYSGAEQEKLSLKNKVNSLSVKVDEHNQCCVKKIDKLQKSNKELEQSVEYLEQLLHDNRLDFLELKDEIKGEYTTSTHLCVHKLIDNNVAFEKIPNVIKAVAQLCGKSEINSIPSVSTIRRINTERLALAQTQLAEKSSEFSNATLYTDETSKRGIKYGGYHLSDEEGNLWVLGLREMANKSARTTLDTFKEILTDIDHVIDQGDQNNQGKPKPGLKILCEIRSTMSDQAATEKCFNDLLQQYRASVLPVVIDNWDLMADTEQEMHSRMYNFFCGLHLLVNMAEVTSSALLKYESANGWNELGAASQRDTSLFVKKSESSIVRTVRTVCKALTRGGDEKNGCFMQFSEFVRQLGEKNRLVSFRGNRFNILFLDGGLVYFHASHIIEFLNNVHGSRSNSLLLAISRDCSVSPFLAGCRALGLLDKLVTAPLWRIIESKGHILDMNTHYETLERFFQRTAKDACMFMEGKDAPFPDLVKDKDKDPVLRKLLEHVQGTGDEMTQQIIQYICVAWQAYICKAVKNHLPQGKYHEVTEDFKEVTKSALKHNKFPERVFGILDHLISVRPNASTLANEAYIMFALNKTANWLQNKSEEEQDKLIKKARMLAADIQKHFKEKLLEISRIRQCALLEKKTLIEKQRLALLKEKENLTNQITYYGLWQTKDNMNSNLSLIKSQSEKKKALGIQIKFRKTVLQQEHADKKIFNISKRDGCDLTVDNLYKNLLILLEAAQSCVSKEHSASTDILIGKRVKHSFNNDVYWGKVISVVPGFETWYNIKYDNDIAIYTYQLMDDYRDGNLEIIPSQ